MDQVLQAAFICPHTEKQHSSPTLPFHLRLRSICCNVLLKIWISLTRTIHHRECRLIIWQLSTKANRGFVPVIRSLMRYKRSSVDWRLKSCLGSVRQKDLDVDLTVQRAGAVDCRLSSRWRSLNYNAAYSEPEWFCVMCNNELCVTSQAWRERAARLNNDISAWNHIVNNDLMHVAYHGRYSCWWVGKEVFLIRPH